MSIRTIATAVPSTVAIMARKLADFTKVDLDSAAPQNNSDLMGKLPVEMRQRIYELALEDSIAEINVSKYRKGDRKKGLPAPCGFAFSCKQAYFESIKLYWSKTTFRFPKTNAEKFDLWLTRICRRRRELLVSVEVGNNTYYYEACKKQGLGRAGLHEILRSANTQLRVCQAGRRGVAEGVMKTNILVPSRGGKLIHFDYARPVKEIWTSAPEEETRAFL